MSGTSPDRVDLVEAFTRYLLLERPGVEDGHTFSISAGAPKHRLGLEPCRAFPPDDLFHNPLGVWRLRPV